MPGPAAGSGIQQHIERMARGRQQRLEKRSQQSAQVAQFQRSPLMALADGPSDAFESRLDAYQRQSARRMLEDFAASGIDEDLEELKSGWASSFKHRPGMPQPRRPMPADLSRTSSHRGRPRDALDWSQAEDEDDEDEYDQPRSILAAQGLRARQRLNGLENLRKLADDDSMTSEDNIFFSRGNNSSFAALADGRASPATTRKGSTQTRPRRRTALSPFKSPAISSSSIADPWDDWERRWSQEFQFFEEAEHARLFRQRQAQEAEEAQREAEWYRRVAEAKQQAETSSRWRPPRPQQHQNQHSKGPSDRSKDDEPHRKHSHDDSTSSAGGRRPQQPPPVPPAPPPASKVPATPGFASFADFGKAWSSFEQKLQTAGTSQKSAWLRCADIPWPTSLSSVSGAAAGDDPAEKKRKLRSALVRWHPDKWAPILEQVVESERAQVMEQVKQVTQRILEEKKRFES
eukprot:TRINITY_DN89730_c0_g1_i1.p1 TRINITY_DN89730_c0_g1~~TRINITY_DN89730_c0_g1_i1.p1  ORF type:complete len:461 (-),score=98.77 TRINITY_DN89730_c0_g1_i1:181-1563(-)